MSMISEFVKKLIGRLEEKQDEYFHGTSDYEEGKYNAYDEVSQIVNQLVEEYKDVSDTNVGKWIPVSEALPDYGIEVIAYDKSYDSIWIVSREQNGSGRDVWENKYGDYEDVDAYDYWQPLPEPYKPEQQKEIPSNHYTERFNRVL